MDVSISGEAGILQSSYYKKRDSNTKIAIILSDHPKRNSHMNEKALYTLFHSYAIAGFNVVRFNYRGIGLSKGVFSDGEDEIIDAANVLDWIEKLNSNYKEVHIAGIGFGAWIGAHLLMRRPEISGFILAAPIAEGCEYNFLNPCDAKGLIINIQNEKESMNEKFSKLDKDLEKMSSRKIINEKIKGANYKFENKLKELFEKTNEFLATFPQPSED